MSSCDHVDPITIAIADDHPVVRDGLRMMLEREKDMRIVGDAPDGVRALALLREREPDVALLDIEMPGISGLDILQSVRELRLDTSCIILTLHNDPLVYHQAAQDGAMGYLLKDSSPTEIRQCVRHVAAGNLYLGQAEHSTNGKNVHTGASEPPAVDSLTPCERKVLRLISENLSTREIADRLCVSPRTIDTHRANISSKLGMHGTNGLLRFAMEHRRAFSIIPGEYR